MIINLNDTDGTYAAKCRTAYRALRYSPLGVTLTFKHDEGTVSALALVLIPTGGVADVEDGIIEGPVDALLVVAPTHHAAVCTDIEEINGVFKLPEDFVEIGRAHV